jgi:hypothetical protein
MAIAYELKLLPKIMGIEMNTHEYMCARPCYCMPHGAGSLRTEFWRLALLYACAQQRNTRIEREWSSTQLICYVSPWYSLGRGGVWSIEQICGGGWVWKLGRCQACTCVLTSRHPAGAPRKRLIFQKTGFELDSCDACAMCGKVSDGERGVSVISFSPNSLSIARRARPY